MSDVFTARWISVDDDLPRKGKRVLVLTKTHKHEPYIASRHQLDGHWETSGGVTHWMRLPTRT